MTPTSVTQLLIVLLFVVPGFVYQTVRISIRGRLPPDVDLSTRIVRSIVTSAVFGLIYLLILGDPLVEAAQGTGAVVDHPRLGAGAALFGGFLFPATCALFREPGWGWWSRLRTALPEIARYDPTPTAWDKVFQDAEHCFIRVLNEDGRWIGGYYGPRSYSTSYPEAHQLFLEQAFDVAEDGAFGDPVDGSKGVLVDCGRVQLVQLIAVRHDEENSDNLAEPADDLADDPAGVSEVE